MGTSAGVSGTLVAPEPSSSTSHTCWVVEALDLVAEVVARAQTSA